MFCQNFGAFGASGMMAPTPTMATALSAADTLIIVNASGISNKSYISWLLLISTLFRTGRRKYSPCLEAVPSERDVSGK
jgi:hypothetical protein